MGLTRGLARDFEPDNIRVDSDESAITTGQVLSVDSGVTVV